MEKLNSCTGRTNIDAVKKGRKTPGYEECGGAKTTLHLTLCFNHFLTAVYSETVAQECGDVKTTLHLTL